LRNEPKQEYLSLIGLRYSNNILKDVNSFSFGQPSKFIPIFPIYYLDDNDHGNYLWAFMQNIDMLLRNKFSWIRTQNTLYFARELNYTSEDLIIRGLYSDRKIEIGLEEL